LPLSFPFHSPFSLSLLLCCRFGEGEKLVRTLFDVAKCYPPAIIFIDELDSLLSARQDNDFEGSRRMKNELLIQMDGASNSNDDRVLVLGATNMPHQLDEAAIRRLTKRLYVPLPNQQAREQLLNRVLAKHDDDSTGEKHGMSVDEVREVARRTRGYSGSDLHNLAREAAMIPLRQVMAEGLSDGGVKRAVPGIVFEHFVEAIGQVKPSVRESDLKGHMEWNKQFGSFQLDNTAKD
jgi:SpoVK/Ycf46/Vps4 family AAA+-type ATPase